MEPRDTSSGHRLITVTDEIMGYIDDTLRKMDEGVKTAIGNAALTPLELTHIGQELIIRSANALGQLGHAALRVSKARERSVQSISKELEPEIISQFTFRGQEVKITQIDQRIFINGIEARVTLRAQPLLREALQYPGVVRRRTALLDTADYSPNLVYSSRDIHSRNDLTKIAREVNGIVPDLISFPKSAHFLVGQQTHSPAKPEAQMIVKSGHPSVEKSASTDHESLKRIERENAETVVLSRYDDYLFVNRTRLMVDKRAYPLVIYLFDHPGVRVARADMLPEYRPSVESFGAKRQSFWLDINELITELNGIVPGIIERRGEKISTRYILFPDLEIPEIKITKTNPTPVRMAVQRPKTAGQTRRDSGLPPDIRRPVVESSTVTPEVTEPPSAIEQSIEQLLGKWRTKEIGAFVSVLSGMYPEIRKGPGGKIILKRIVQQINDRYVLSGRPELLIIDRDEDYEYVSLNEHYLKDKPNTAPQRRVPTAKKAR